MQDEMPQLRMGFTRFDALPPVDGPSGYGVRTYAPGDEAAWLSLLSTGDFGKWDRDRLDRMIAGERAPLPLAGTFFATHDGRPVGTACTFLHPGARGDVAELGWVAVLPAHRGHALGAQLCGAVLRYVRELGLPYAFLLTEDFRVPALKTYVRLGFELEITDPRHTGWWAANLPSLARGPNTK